MWPRQGEVVFGRGRHVNGANGVVQAERSGRSVRNEPAKQLRVKGRAVVVVVGCSCVRCFSRCSDDVIGPMRLHRQSKKGQKEKVKVVNDGTISPRSGLRWTNKLNQVCTGMPTRRLGCEWLRGTQMETVRLGGDAVNAEGARRLKDIVGGFVFFLLIFL